MLKTYQKLPGGPGSEGLASLNGHLELVHSTPLWGRLNLRADWQSAQTLNNPPQDGILPDNLARCRQIR